MKSPVKAFMSLSLFALAINGCSPIQQTTSVEPLSSLESDNANPIQPSSPSAGIEMEYEMGKDQISDIIKYLPELQSTSKDPAWIGFVVQKGCGSYFQYTYHDGQFWLEYMLFPEEQLVIEDQFRVSVLTNEMSINEVEIGGGDRYFEVPLGAEIETAFSSSMDVIKSACHVNDQVEVEFMNELD